MPADTPENVRCATPIPLESSNILLGIWVERVAAVRFEDTVHCVM